MLQEIGKLAWRMCLIFGEEYGLPCLLLPIPAAISWYHQHQQQGVSGFIALIASLGWEFAWGAVLVIFYLMVKAHISLRAEDRKRITELEDLRKTRKLKITLEKQLVICVNRYFFRGHIQNDGDTIEGVQVRLVGHFVDLDGRVAGSAGEMNLYWSGEDKGLRDVHNGADEIFEIAVISPGQQLYLFFRGWKGQQSLSNKMGPGFCEFEIHVTGRGIEKIVHPVKIAVESRFDDHCVKVLRG
jgi:hypothetical protein